YLATRKSLIPRFLIPITIFAPSFAVNENTCPFSHPAISSFSMISTVSFSLLSTVIALPFFMYKTSLNLYFLYFIYPYFLFFLLIPSFFFFFLYFIFSINYFIIN